MPLTRLVRLGVVALILGWAGSVAAQEIAGFNISGEIEPGVRVFVERPSPTRQGKFEEYRDIPPGLFLHSLKLGLVRPDESYGLDLSGARWGHEDQEFALRVGRLGRWQLLFEWDQTPHTYSTTGRFLADEVERGVYRLPSTRPALVTHNSARTLDEISMRTDTGRLLFTLSPTPDLDVTANYTMIRRDGERPMGMSFGSPGSNFYEVLEPIEQTIHDFRLGAVIARERWQFQAGYTASVFVNDMRWMRADNPCFPGAPAGCAAGDFAAGSPITGQMSLPPSNMAHTLNLAGGINLPLRTRINASASYAVHLQNDRFLPHTINPAIASPTLALRERSLHGNEQNVVALVSATSRPFSLPLTLSGKYRFHDMMDFSDEIVFQGHVVNDKTLSVGRRLAGRFAYMRQNADVDARYQVAAPVAVTIGTGWERLDRNSHWEVEDSDEVFGKAAIDATPFDWLLARLTYRPSFRRIAKYNTRAHAEHAVGDEDGATISQGQSVLLRKFNEGERDRQRVDALLQFTPLETLTISPTVGYRWDDYVRSVLGLQSEQAWNAGIDVSWTPVERIHLSLGYSHERTTQQMRSRSRPVVGGFGVDFADYDWVTNIADTIDTITVGLKATLIPKTLDWTFSGSYQYALGRYQTNNPVDPASSTAGNNATARAKPWPAFEDTALRLDTALRYHFHKSWTASLGYVFESFQKNDWRTDRLDPFEGPSAIWLGNDSRNYAAQLVGITVGYRFGK
jgi:MtrB/PioB family decaheme-associated outer membrane protein